MADDTQDMQTAINAWSAVVTATATALADPTTTRQQAAAERQMQNYAQAIMLLLAANLAPTVAPTRVIVQEGDTLFSLAQSRLGSALKYGLIQAANDMVGLALTPGQTLVMPATQ